MRRILPIFAFLLLFAACSAQGQLAGRAADYYSMLAGYNSKAKLSAYYSPAYRKMLNRDALKVVDKAISANQPDKSRYPRAKASDIAIHIEGRFALTTANPALGDVYSNQRSTKWVKAGTNWYLYLGSAAEAKAYGPFPVGMMPPKYVDKNKDGK